MSSNSFYCLIFSVCITVGAISSSFLINLSAKLIIIFFITCFYFLYTYKKKFYCIIIISICLLFIGAWKVKINSIQVTNIFKTALNKKNIFHAHVKEKVKFGKNFYFIFEIESINNKELEILLINRCKENYNTLKIGDFIYINNLDSNRIFDINKIYPKLYKFWANKQIFYEFKGCHKVNIIRNDLSRLEKFKSYGQLKTLDWLKSAVSEKKAYLLFGFLTGKKQFIDKDIKENLAIAGVYHILAVSGLHIGIVFLILQRLFSFITRIKIWSLTVSLLSLIGVWIFCYWSDFSPSAIRASFMITLFCIARYKLKDLFCHKNIIQIFFVCLLFNLIYNPLQVFNVSFQFSYLAYGGILIFYRRINNLNPLKRNTLISKVWAIGALSLSAQSTILPLSLLYFKYFSSYFILGNLIITPVIPIVYILCLISVLSPFDIISIISNYSLEYLTGFIIKATEIIKMLNWSKIDVPEYNSINCIILYLFLISWVLIFIIKKQIYWVIFCISLILSIFLITYKNIDHKNELLYMTYDKSHLIKLRDRGKTYYYNFNCSFEIESFLDKQIRESNVSFITNCKPSRKYIKSNNIRLLVLNQYHIKQKSDLKKFKNTEYVLLINSPYINFKIIKEELPNLKLIMFDSSNKSKHINIWKKLCKRNNISYQYIYKSFKFI